MISFSVIKKYITCIFGAVNVREIFGSIGRVFELFRDTNVFAILPDDCFVRSMKLRVAIKCI